MWLVSGAIWGPCMDHYWESQAGGKHGVGEWCNWMMTRSWGTCMEHCWESQAGGEHVVGEWCNWIMMRDWGPCMDHCHFGSSSSFVCLV